MNVVHFSIFLSFQLLARWSTATVTRIRTRFFFKATLTEMPAVKNEMKFCNQFFGTKSTMGKAHVFRSQFKQIKKDIHSIDSGHVSGHSGPQCFSVCLLIWIDTSITVYHPETKIYLLTYSLLGSWWVNSQSRYCNADVSQLLLNLKTWLAKSLASVDKENSMESAQWS